MPRASQKDWLVPSETKGKDETSQCRDCLRFFPLPAAEREWYTRKGLHSPTRCRDCRLRAARAQTDGTWAFAFAGERTRTRMRNPVLRYGDLLRINRK